MTCIKTPDGWVNRSDEPCTTDQHGNPTRHCKRNNRCGRHLEPHDEMCPVCVGKIRTNLLAVEELAALMEAEAVVAGVNSEAANLAGPWTNAVRWDWARVNAVRAAWAKGADVEPVRADFAVDLLHPGTCLSYWERLLREDLEHDAVTLVSETISDSRRYLDWVLTDLARDEDRVLVLVELAGDVQRLRTHMEAVRHDSLIPELGAPCPACKEPAPRLKLDHDRADVTGASDQWVCSRDHNHRWTEAEYRHWVGTAYVQHATHLPSRELADRIRVPESTIRRWASGSTPLLRSRGRHTDGRKLYDVGQAIELRDAVSVSG